MPGRLGEPPSPPFYSPVSTHGAQAPQGGPAHSAAGTIGTLVLGAVRAEIGSGFGTTSAIPNSLTFVERRQSVW